MRIRILWIAMLSLLVLPLLAADFSVRAVKGTVEVRRGVMEEWRKVKVGDLLKPEDSMRTGPGASATIEMDKRNLVVPELTILDISDVRQLSQEDFLLKLAMENILAVPPREKDELAIPSATVLHGENKSKTDLSVSTDGKVGEMQLHGARVLYDNTYYATSILKSKETLRTHPEVRSNYDARLTVAMAFEKMKLTKEAITEYSLLSKENLPAPQAKKVQSALDKLKQTK
ncbi:MAG: hypothetical protein NTZ35_10895 [Ignavibacteriales bacterium]|nr:hypothetical protein [Ignavibacteriales bacterium]